MSVNKELNNEGVGLGDVVAKITEVTGIKKVVELMNGAPCAECAKRQKEMNRIRLKNLNFKNGRR